MPASSPDLFDRKIASALQAAPQVQVPRDFAARVAAEAHARFGPVPQARPSSQFGAWSIRIAAAFLLAAMLLLARYPRLSPGLSFTLEATFCAEFIAIVLYLGLRPLTSRLR